MPTAAEIRAEVRAEGRLRLRAALLDAARATTVEQGWGSVRMGAVAARVGVSRQTVHAEFGTKEALGQAVVLREADQFLVEVRRTLNRHPEDVVLAVREAATRTLDLLAGNPLLASVLTGPARPGDETLLPMLTSRGQPLVGRATAEVASWLADRCPDAPADLVADLADSVVRLVVSHALQPADPPSVVGARLSRIVATGLGMPAAAPPCTPVLSAAGGTATREWVKGPLHHESG